jgi:hypothetical protein
MKEVSRIVVGLTALRIIQNEENYSCEMFQSSEWIELSPTKVHQLSFDKKICDWLNQHYHSRPKMADEEQTAASECK